MAENIEVDGFVKQRQELESLLMSNPQMEKKVQGLIRKVLLAARRTIANDAKDAMKSDPRKAYKAVKSAVYRQILGGSVSLYNRKRGKFDSYEPPHTLKAGQRGGNRRSRSNDTKAQNGYFGKARAFVLRFYNSGTVERQTRFGNRGAMPSRRVFSTSAVFQMETASKEISQMIEEIMQKEFNSAT